MTTWVALLRAVNGSSANKLPMAEFRDLLKGLGLAGARTVAQTGNAAFRSDRPAPDLARAVADAVYARFGFRPPVLVLPRTALAAAVAGNPWPKVPDDEVHIVFAERDLPRATGDFLKSVASAGEDYRWQGRVLWLHLPGGFGRSTLAKRVTALPIDMTVRSLGQARAILDAADKLEEARC